MQSGLASPHHIFWILIATPFVAFAAYIAWLVIPIVVTEVVPAVVQAVTTSN